LNLRHINRSLEIFSNQISWY